MEDITLPGNQPNAGCSYFPCATCGRIVAGGESDYMPDNSSPADLVNLGRYPIHDLSADAARDLTRHCRRQLDQTGACELPEFLTGDAVAMLVQEGDALSPLAYHSVVSGTAYLEVPDSSWPPDHPRRHFDQTSVGVIAYDQFPEHSALHRLYEWQVLMDFIAAALGKDKLYRYADPMGALNLAVMGDGERLHWH